MTIVYDKLKNFSNEIGNTVLFKIGLRLKNKQKKNFEFSISEALLFSFTSYNKADNRYSTLYTIGDSDDESNIK